MSQIVALPPKVDDSAQDAGMLLELAVRRLGFAFRKEGES